MLSTMADTENHVGPTGIMGEWTTQVTAWATELRAAGRAQGTINLRTSHIRRLAAYLNPSDATDTIGPWDVTREHLIRWIATGGKGTHADWSLATMRSAAASARAFYTWAVKTKRITLDQHPAADMPRIRVPPPCPRPAPDDIITAGIHDTPDQEVALAIRIAAETGARREEVARIHSRDIEGNLLRIHGKGRRERLVPLNPGLLSVLRACGPGWIFPSPRCPGRHVTPEHLGKRVSEALGQDWSMHSLRHAFGTALGEAGVDIDVIRDLMGHSSTEITTTYVRRSMQLKRQVVAQVARRLVWVPPESNVRHIAGGAGVAVTAAAALLALDLGVISGQGSEVALRSAAHIAWHATRGFGVDPFPASVGTAKQARGCVPAPRQC